jgi:hypothetical protein
MDDLFENGRAVQASFIPEIRLKTSTNNLQKRLFLKIIFVLCIRTLEAIASQHKQSKIIII